jgi:heterotetrameric sarcosine oxidase gamma subunit
VPELALTARPPLDGYRQQFDDLEIAEVTDMSLVSIATPMGGQDTLDTALKQAFNAEIPAVGRSTRSGDGGTRFLGLQPGQVFAMFADSGDQAVAAISGRLGDAGYYTDQSDSWVILQLSGPCSRRALERICPIDLHPDAFPEEAVTRTVMEHLGTIILRTGSDTFILMSARSSAKSFQHAVLTSINNVQ